MDELLLREVCELVGVTRRAIQGYEKSGLVAATGKNKMGHLLYDKTAIDTIKEIKLINAPDSESVAHYVEIGAADIYCNNVSSDEILRMSGKKIDINSNNMIYIGINQNYGVLGENALRQALSSGIDRQKLCRDAFYNNALPATGFFNPVWEPVKAVQNIQITAKNEITIENLEKIGYNRLDSKGLRANINGIPLKLTLLVNSENRTKVTAAQLIASQLLDYGISITVVEKPYEQYMQSLVDGNFQLYLGEIKLTENMDISSMVVEGGSAAFGLAVPKVNVIIGKAFGSAYVSFNSKSVGADLVYAVDDSEIGALPADSGVAFAWDQYITEKKTRESLIEDWKMSVSSPVHAAESGEIDDIISVNELRARICSALLMLSYKGAHCSVARRKVLPL